MDQFEFKVKKKSGQGQYKSKQRYRITYLVEKVGLSKLMKLWKLLLISLRVLMTMHLLRSKIRILTQYCFQLFEYYIFYFLIVFPSPSL